MPSAGGASGPVRIAVGAALSGLVRAPGAVGSDVSRLHLAGFASDVPGPEQVSGAVSADGLGDVLRTGDTEAPGEHALDAEGTCVSVRELGSVGAGTPLAGHVPLSSVSSVSDKSRIAVGPRRPAGFGSAGGSSAFTAFAGCVCSMGGHESGGACRDAVEGAAAVGEGPRIFCCRRWTRDICAVGEALALFTGRFSPSVYPTLASTPVGGDGPPSFGPPEREPSAT